MQIAGKGIDIEKMKAHALEKTRDELERRYCMSDCPKDDVDTLLLFFSWFFIRRILEEGSSAAAPVNAEKVMATVIRSGVDRDSVSYRNGKFRFKLENHRYRVERCTNGFGAAPTGCNSGEAIEKISEDSFTDFLYKFDSLVPEIIDTGSVLVREITERQLEEKKAETARELAYTTVNSILEEFLRPLGIDWTFSMQDGAVSLTLRQVKEAELSIPMQDLAEKLKDTESVLSSMKIVSQQDLPGHDEWALSPHYFSGVGFTV